jgi:hypothetical protein
LLPLRRNVSRDVHCLKIMRSKSVENSLWSRVKDFKEKTGSGQSRVFR